MKQAITIGAAALLAGGAFGYLIGRAGGDGGGESAAEAAIPERGAKVARAEGSEAGERRTRRFRSTEEVLREPGQMARLQAMVDLYADMDPAQLAEEAAKLDRLPFADRILASTLLFSRWGEIDPLGAIEYSKTMGFVGNFVRPTVVRSWASVDPVNAAQYYEANSSELGSMGGPRGRGDQASELIAREWAKLDPEAAMAWAGGLEGGERGAAMVSVVEQLAETDPARAAALAASDLGEEDRGRAYARIADRWAGEDFEAAEAWIRTLSGGERDEAMAAALGTLASTDPEGAASRALAMAEGEARDEAMGDVAQAWSRQSPAEAASWLVEQAPADGDDAMRRVMGNYVSQDAVAALDFIQAQEPGEMRDAGVQSYLWTQRDADVATSLELAESISDERSRERAIGMTARRWMEEDAEAARAYVEQSTLLGDSSKERILNDDGDRRGRRRP